MIGQVAADPGGRLRVRLAADYERLEFLRVLRHYGTQRVTDNAQVITPEGPLPAEPDSPDMQAEAEVELEVGE